MGVLRIERGRVGSPTAPDRIVPELVRASGIMRSAAFGHLHPIVAMNLLTKQADDDLLTKRFFVQSSSHGSSDWSTRLEFRNV